MSKIRDLAPEHTPEAAYGLAAAMGMEHLGNLLNFLDAKIGDLVIFDPEAKVKEQVIRDAIKVGARVCHCFVHEGKAQGIDSAVLRELWPVLVEMAVLVPPPTHEPPD